MLTLGVGGHLLMTGPRMRTQPNIRTFRTRAPLLPDGVVPVQSLPELPSADAAEASVQSATLRSIQPSPREGLLRLLLRVLPRRWRLGRRPCGAKLHAGAGRSALRAGAKVFGRQFAPGDADRRRPRTRPGARRASGAPLAPGALRAEPGRPRQPNAGYLPRRGFAKPLTQPSC